jgi:hypothetical protein
VFNGEILLRFDYGTFTAGAAEEMRAAAERIRQHLRRQCEDIIAAGRELLDVKARLRHGQFSPWLMTEFSWSERTAQNYINVALAFGGKTENFSVLPTNALYRLAAPTVPVEVRETLLTRAEAGETITGALATESIRRARQKPTELPGDSEISLPCPSRRRPVSGPNAPEKAMRFAELLAEKLGAEFAAVREVIRGLTPEEWGAVQTLPTGRQS